MSSHKYNHLRIKDPLTNKWKHPTAPHRVRGLPLHLYIETRTKIIETGCWDWIGKANSRHSNARHKDLRKGSCSVGEAAWECFFGPVPEGLDVCHECDNGHCANPMHLFLGTRKENMWDCISKGRFPVGKKHYRWNR